MMYGQKNIKLSGVMSLDTSHVTQILLWERIRVPGRLIEEIFGTEMVPVRRHPYCLYPGSQLKLSWQNTVGLLVLISKQREAESW